MVPAGRGDILNDISLRFAPGRMTVVTGPNGGGKTSLAKVIAGVEQATGGRIVLNGEDLTKRERHRARAPRHRLRVPAAGAL